jgi:DNA-binding CsgD family transcriptional regulator
MLLNEKHPLLLLSAELAELCRPLEMFHIHHFTYQKQFNDGTRISLSNKPQWIDDYYNLKLYQSSLFEQKPSTYKSAFNIWLGDYDLLVYRHGREVYNTSHCISITEPEQDACAHYLFSTAPDKPEAIHYLSNNMDILYHFILFIKDRGIDILKKAHKNRLIVQKSFIDPEPSPIDNKNFFQIMEINKQRFFDQTSILKDSSENSLIIPSASYPSTIKINNISIPLTPREADCLYFLIQGKTAKEIGKLLSVSNRTVEIYIAQLRSKTGSKNRVELLHKLNRQELEDFITQRRDSP